MTARKLLASAAMSAALLMSLTQVAAACDDPPTPPAKAAKPANRAKTAASRASVRPAGDTPHLARPTLRPVVGNGKASGYMDRRAPRAPRSI